MRKATVNKVKLNDVLYSPNRKIEVLITEVGRRYKCYEVNGFEVRVDDVNFKHYFKGFFIKPKFIDYYDILRF